MIKVECFPLGVLSANCYFVYDPDNKVSMLVDTGDSSTVLQARIDSFGGEKLQYILLTHGHFDHIGGTAWFKERYPQVRIVLSEGDLDFPSDQRLNLAHHFDQQIIHFRPDIIVKDGDELPFGKETIRVLSTPGHTRGGVCYLLGEHLFTGDTLISGTTGRTDFPTGNIKAMYRSIERLAALDGDYYVYCGHGEMSTLENERLYNMFMRKYFYDDLSK